VTGVLDTEVDDHDVTLRRVYICTRVCAFFVFVLSNFSTICVCITGVFKHLHARVGRSSKRGLSQLVHV